MFLCYINILCSIARMFPMHNKNAYSFNTHCMFILPIATFPNMNSNCITHNVIKINYSNYCARFFQVPTQPQTWHCFFLCPHSNQSPTPLHNIWHLMSFFNICYIYTYIEAPTPTQDYTTSFLSLLCGGSPYLAWCLLGTIIPPYVL
jgi:hypothetical protein